MVIAKSLDDPGRLADLAASNLDLRVEEAQEVLEILDPVARLRRVHDFVKREVDLLSMQREIDSMARDEMERSQREYFLRHQMKAIMTELGEGNELAEDIDEYRRKADDVSRCPSTSARRWITSSSGSSGCTRTRPRPRRCATISTGSRGSRGASARATT